MPEPQVLGFDEAGSGRHLVLIPGFPLDARMWEHQLEGLSEDRRVIAVDLRGRRRSKDIDPTSATIDLYADDVAKTIRRLGQEKVDLAGLSMGGYVVFSFFRKYPEMLRSLILIDTKAAGDSPEAQEQREKVAAEVLEKGTRPLTETLLPKILAPGATEEVKDRTFEMFRDTPPETAAADSLAMKDRADSAHDLGSIKVPTLVLHGDADQIMPIDDAKHMASLIPGAKFVSIPRAGHLAPLENPDQVNFAIAKFLGELDSAQEAAQEGDER